MSVQSEEDFHVPTITTDLDYISIQADFMFAKYSRSDFVLEVLFGSSMPGDS